MRAKNNSDIKSKLVAFLLLLAMCAWLWPWSLMEVQAATELNDPRVTVNSATGDVEQSTWDCVWFGHYKQSSDGNGDFKKEPIKWRVLSVNGNDAFLIADRNLDCQRYNEEYVDVTWETCTLRSWLNGYDDAENIEGMDYSDENFINEAFSLEEQQAIRETHVANENNPLYDTEGGNDTTDRIYLLSIEEATDTMYGFSSDYDAYDVGRYAKNTDYVNEQGAYASEESGSEGNGWWWLRSPGGLSDYAANVYSGGNVDCFGDDVDIGGDAIRPALCLNLESNRWSYAGTVSSDGTVDEVEPPVLQNPQTASDETTTWDCVWFGNYKQGSNGNDDFKKDPIKWRVLSASKDDAFLIADQNLDCQKYNQTATSVTWETCTLRSWLNGYDAAENIDEMDYSSENFINEAFSHEEQQSIQATHVANENNPLYDTEGGNNTTDRIYLLSIEEATDTMCGFSSDYDMYDVGRCAKNTDYVNQQGAGISDEGNGFWWLRSPGGSSNDAANVNLDGDIDCDDGDVTYNNIAVRPVLHLNLESNCWFYAGTVSNDGIIDEKAMTYKISYDANGGTGAPSAQTKIYDEALTLSSTVPTRAGYDFLGWSESKTASAATYKAGGSYTNNSNATLYAIWKEQPKVNGNQDSNNSAGGNKQTNTPAGKKAQTISASSKTLTYKGKSVYLNAKTSGNGKLSYSSSNKKIVTVSTSGKITPKECGTAKITIKAAETGEYKATEKTITAKVTLKKPALKLKRTGRTSMKASWKKVPGASGYQVSFSDMKKKTTNLKRTKKRSATARALKRGKKYQFKIRAYRKVGKKTIYGPYSKTLKIKW